MMSSAEEPTSRPAPSSPAAAAASRASRQRDPVLWGLGFAAIAILAIGFFQSPEVPWEPPGWADRLLQPLELNARARLPELPRANLHAISFGEGDEANRGLVAGESGTLLETLDGGRTWEKIEVPTADGKPAPGLYSIAYRRDGRDYAVVAGRDGAIYRFNRGSVDPVKLPPGPPSGSGMGGSSWEYADVLGVALDPHSVAILAGPQGLVAYDVLGGTGPSAVVSDQPVRSVAVDFDSGDVVYVGPTGIGIRQAQLQVQAGPPRTDQRIADAAYSAVAIDIGTYFAAGNEKFRIAPLGLPGGAEHAVPDEGDEGPVVVHACALPSPVAGWAVGANGRVWEVKTGTTVAGGQPGLTVDRRDIPGFNKALYAVWAFNASDLIVGGEDGALFRTRDGGETWVPLVRNCWEPGWDFYVKLPPAWSWLAVGLLAVGGRRRWRALPIASEERDPVADQLTTDRPLAPGEIDRLGFAPFVAGLSAYLRNDATQAPLTLAVTGPWGAGKSSFMNLLRADLDGRGLRTVWFNAWHHQQEPQILAPLLSAIQAEAAPSLFSDKLDLAIRFRWRLLLRRLRSQHTALLIAALLLSFGLGVGAGLGWKTPFELWDEWSAVWTKDAASIFGHFVSGGSFLGTILGLLLFLWKGLATFGVNPASLLATEAGKTGGLALSAQTDFRRQFANQFGEVTAALEPYPLVIFIDDLDRCEQGKVFQILEAINYLVSNGSCFVVLGMSEERVRDSVALGFKDLPADFGEVPASVAPGGPPAAARSGWDRQRELAQNYLEKLVQLRVDLPRPDLEAAQRIVRAQQAEAETNPVGAPPPGWWEQNLSWIVPALLVSGLVVAAFLGGRFVAPKVSIGAGREAAASAPASPGPNPAATAAAGGGAGAAAGAMANGPAPGNVAAVPVHVFTDRGLAVADPEMGRRDIAGRVVLGLVAIGTLLMVWVAERLWQRRRSVVVRNSPEFDRACDRWTAALHRLLGGGLTPRTLKRFKNRVRFYSMMRGGEGGATSLADLSDPDLVALGALEQAGLLPPGIPDLGALDPAAIMELPIDDPLRLEAISAVGKIRRNGAGARGYRQARGMVARA